MTATWGGPQWILLTWLLSTLVIAVAARVAGQNTRPFNEWIGWFSYRLISTALLVGLLAWGGFWGTR